jgi:hypothetical protein
MPLDDSASALNKLIDDATQTVTGRISGNVGGKVNVKLANGQRIEGKNYLEAIAFSGCDAPGDVTCFKTDRGWLAVGKGRQENLQTLRQYRRSDTERETDEVKECPILAYREILDVDGNIEKIQYWLGGDRVPILLKEIEVSDLPGFIPDGITYENDSQYSSNYSGTSKGSLTFSAGTFTGSSNSTFTSSGGGENHFSRRASFIVNNQHKNMFMIAELTYSVNNQIALGTASAVLYFSIGGSGGGSHDGRSSYSQVGSFSFSDSTRKRFPIDQGDTYCYVLCGAQSYSSAYPGEIDTPFSANVSGSVAFKLSPIVYLVSEKQNRYIWLGFPSVSGGIGYYITVSGQSVTVKEFSGTEKVDNKKDWRESLAYLDASNPPPEPTDSCKATYLEAVDAHPESDFVNLYQKNLFSIDPHQSIPDVGVFREKILLQGLTAEVTTAKTASGKECTLGAGKTIKMKVKRLGGKDENGNSLPDDFEILQISPIVYKK